MRTAWAEEEYLSVGGKGRQWANYKTETCENITMKPIILYKGYTYTNKNSNLVKQIKGKEFSGV